MPPDAVVAAAVERSCKTARVPGTVQSYQCRRSRVKQFQTRMRTPPMLWR